MLLNSNNLLSYLCHPLKHGWLSKFIMKTSHLGKCTVHSKDVNVLHACASMAKEFFSKFYFSVMSGPLVFLNNENELGAKCKGSHYCLSAIDKHLLWYL